MLVDFDHIAVSDPDAGERLQELEVGVLSDGEHERIGFELLEAAGADGPLAVGSISICSTIISSVPNCFTVDIHFTLTPSANASCTSCGWARMWPVRTIDEHGFFGAQPPCDARGIDGGVTGADDADDAAKRGRVSLLDLLQQSSAWIIRPPSIDGMSRWLPSCAPIARNTASKRSPHPGVVRLLWPEETLATFASRFTPDACPPSGAWSGSNPCPRQRGGCR